MTSPDGGEVRSRTADSVPTYQWGGGAEDKGMQRDGKNLQWAVAYTDVLHHMTLYPADCQNYWIF